MSAVFLILAFALSCAGLVIHATRGRKLIVEPLLKSDLHMVPKHTLAFAWNWGAVTMAVLAVSYLAPLYRESLLPLAMLATVYGYALGALSYVTMRRHGFRVAQMPQWILFWAASLSGFLGWGVFA